jgi:hypothetical protein
MFVVTLHHELVQYKEHFQNNTVFGRFSGSSSGEWRIIHRCCAGAPAWGGRPTSTSASSLLPRLHRVPRAPRAPCPRPLAPPSNARAHAHLRTTLCRTPRRSSCPWRATSQPATTFATSAMPSSSCVSSIRCSPHSRHAELRRRACARSARMTRAAPRALCIRRSACVQVHLQEFPCGDLRASAQIFPDVRTGQPRFRGGQRRPLRPRASAAP